jgi:type IV pilus assembly protein PilW
MNQRGFTLIEVMISLVIGLFILSGVMFTYLSMKITTKSTLEIGELQESGRIAMEILKDDIELAGFWGTYYGDTLSTNVSIPALPTTDCENGANSGSFPNNPDVNFIFIQSAKATQKKMFNCIGDALIGSDILQIKRLSGRSITIDESKADKYYFVSTYVNGDITPGTSVNIAPLADNASLWGYKHHTYYIASETYSQGSKSINVPTLKRMTLSTSGLTEETIMEGVENIRFLYGVDINGDNRVDTYRNEAQMQANAWDTSMAPILTVQVFLLIRSLEQDFSTPAVNKTFVLGGADRSLTFTDQFKRTLFVSTIKITNGGSDEWAL